MQTGGQRDTHRLLSGWVEGYGHHGVSGRSVPLAREACLGPRFDRFYCELHTLLFLAKVSFLRRKTNNRQHPGRPSGAGLDTPHGVRLSIGFSRFFSLLPSPRAGTAAAPRSLRARSGARAWRDADRQRRRAAPLWRWSTAAPATYHLSARLGAHAWELLLGRRPMRGSCFRRTTAVIT